MEPNMDAKINQLVDHLMEDYSGGKTIDEIKLFEHPNRDTVVDILEKLRKIIYPGYYKNNSFKIYTVRNNVSMLLEDVIFNLIAQITIVLKYSPEYEGADSDVLAQEAERITFEFLDRIPKIREYIETDVQAAFDGDPAAYNKEEIVLCYPGLLASTVNRLAHELFLLKVPLIPRMMTEYAHSRTGIDIHPGATIGRYFFMDHGTGIVVGETSVIGEHVKIYQGVTIGALSTRGGQSLRGAKRHPTIEDDVTIYAGASILGGETVIGKGSVIGSNVFITSSVKPGTRMSVKTQELVIRHREEIEGPRESRPEGTKPENWY